MSSHTALLLAEARIAQRLRDARGAVPISLESYRQPPPARPVRARIGRSQLVTPAQRVAEAFRRPLESLTKGSLNS